MRKVISFPHLGYYHIVFKYFLSNATKCQVVVPPVSTKRTIELGNKYSPDFVCVPFKYNLGNYIEATEHIQKAVQMEPQNGIYQKAMQDMKRTQNDYNSASEAYGRYADSMTSMCKTFCALHCLCFCCGC